MKKILKNSLIHLLSLVMLTSFLSCSDLDSEPEDNPAITAEANCELDLDGFANFFQQKLDSEIDCLKTSLERFMEAARQEGRTDRRGYLSLTQLINYLKQNEREIYDEDLKDLVTAFFNISYLIIGGDKDFISPEGVGQLTNFLKFINDEMVDVYRVIVPCDKRTSEQKCENEEVSYAVHELNRGAIQRTLEKIKAEIKNTGIVNQDSLRFLKLQDLIELFKTEDNQLNIEKVLSVLFIKKAFVGGDKETLTNKQMFNPEDESSSILGKILELGLVTFDAYKAPKIKFLNQYQELTFYEDLAKNLKENLYQTPTDSSVIATIPELIKAVDLIFPDLIGEGVKIAKFKESIIELKDIFLEDTNVSTVSDEKLTFAHVNKGIDFGLEILAMGISFNQNYMDNLAIMVDETPISRDLVQCYNLQKSSAIQNNCERFNRIARNYRYYGGNYKLPFFADGYIRNKTDASGMFEIGLIEKVLEKAFVFYDDDDLPVADARRGEMDYKNGVNRNKKTSEYNLYLRQIRNILKKHQDLLVEIGVVVPGRIFEGEYIASSDNVVLMSSLFQNQSNGTISGDKAYVEVFEFTELAISLLSAIDLKDFFSEEMLSLCRGDLIDGRVSPDCFRRNFRIVIDTPIPGSHMAISDYMPKLFNYLKKLDDTELYDYVEESEKFTKMCMNYSLTPEEFSLALEGEDPYAINYSQDEGEEIPLSKTDMFAVFAGLFNVESTLNRFDVNNNNIMDTNEVYNAFVEVYQGVIRNIVRNDSSIQILRRVISDTKLARKIFYYMIKKEKTPSGPGFLFTGNKTPATRKKIGAILTAVGEKSDSNNPAEQCYNPYCCDAFRQVIDNETGKPRDLNKSEFDKIIKACRVKFKKDNYDYPYDVCERI